MKKLKRHNILVIIGTLLIFISSAVFAQQKQSQHKKVQVFIDHDGDGYNDNAPDHDGDGIPNELDPDWTKGHNGKMNYIDVDGDGINDLIHNNNQIELQNGNIHQNLSGESNMNNNHEKQNSHQRNKSNK